jgi:hypothetical protein
VLRLRLTQASIYLPGRGCANAQIVLVRPALCVIDEAHEEGDG